MRGNSQSAQITIRFVQGPERAWERVALSLCDKIVFFAITFER